MKTLLVLASIVSLSFLVAGCGGGSPSGVASVASSTTTTATAQNRPVAFPRCMRSHGVPNFPDLGKPTPQQAGVSDSQFQAAVTACRRVLPNGGAPPETQQQRQTQLADELSFARCMRSHGVARFPDPTAQGELSIEMVQAAGIDVHSPQVLRVVQTCLPSSHGGLTAAKVREAIDNAGH